MNCQELNPIVAEVPAPSQIKLNNFIKTEELINNPINLSSYVDEGSFEFTNSNSVYNHAFHLGCLLPVIQGPCDMYKKELK